MKEKQVHEKLPLNWAMDDFDAIDSHLSALP